MFIKFANIFNQTFTEKEMTTIFWRKKTYSFAIDCQICLCNNLNICLQYFKYLMDKSQVCVMTSFRWKREVFEKQLM